MRHHVVGTRIAWIEGERGAGSLLGQLEFPVLFEAKGMHGKHGMVAGHVAGPCRHQRGHAAMQAFGIAGDIVERMGRPCSTFMLYRRSGRICSGERLGRVRRASVVKM
jgi:hypothetical protein